MQDTLEEKLGATEWESGKMEVQWNNIKKCALGNTNDLVVKVDRKARKQWMTWERISKMYERRQ
jgi:hypothetical protein